MIRADDDRRWRLIMGKSVKPDIVAARLRAVRRARQEACMRAAADDRRATIRAATAELQGMRGRNHSDKEAEEVVKLMLEELGEPFEELLDAWNRINWSHD
jgi:hypothetical protein